MDSLCFSAHGVAGERVEEEALALRGRLGAAHSVTDVQPEDLHGAAARRLSAGLILELDEGCTRFGSESSKGRKSCGREQM